MVVISPDTVAETAKMRRKCGLTFTLLSDESLAVTQLYNLVHKTYTPARGPIRPLAIPTTFLIGTDGIVKWIDMAEDWRVRSNVDRVLSAVEKTLTAGS